MRPRKMRALAWAAGISLLAGNFTGSLAAGGLQVRVHAEEIPAETEEMQVEEAPAEDTVSEKAPAEDTVVEEAPAEDAVPEKAQEDAVLEEEISDTPAPPVSEEAAQVIEEIPEDAVSEEAQAEDAVSEEAQPEDSVPEEVQLENMVSEDTVQGVEISDTTAITVSEEEAPAIEEIPEDVVSEEAQPEDSASEEAPAEDAVSEEAPAEDTVSEEMQPEGMVPNDAVQGEEISDTSATTISDEAVQPIEEFLEVMTQATGEIPEETPDEWTEEPGAASQESVEVPDEEVYTAEKMPEAPAITEKMPEAPAITEKMPEAPAITEKMSEAPAIPESIPEEAIAGKHTPKETLTEENTPGSEETVTSVPDEIKVLPEEPPWEQGIEKEALLPELLPAENRKGGSENASVKEQSALPDPQSGSQENTVGTQPELSNPEPFSGPEASAQEAGNGQDSSETFSQNTLEASETPGTQEIPALEIRFPGEAGGSQKQDPELLQPSDENKESAWMDESIDPEKHEASWENVLPGEAGGSEKGIRFSIETASIAGETLLVSARRVDIPGEELRVSVRQDLASPQIECILEDIPQDRSGDGIYRITAQALDGNGEVIRTEQEIRINRFGSRYSFREDSSDVLEDKMDTEAGGERVICERNLDEVTDTVILCSRDGGQMQICSGDQLRIGEELSRDGWYEYQYRLPEEMFTEEGEYEVQICSRDKAGNSSSLGSSGQTMRILVDHTAPDVLVTGIEQGAVYHEEELWACLDIRDRSAIRRIRVFENDILKGEFSGDEVKNGLFKWKLHQQEKQRTLTFAVTDTAGNTSVTGPVQFWC